jgi:hypothetical protein
MELQSRETECERSVGQCHLDHLVWAVHILMWKSHGDFLGFFGLVQISRGGVRPERDYTCIESPSSEKETFTMIL